MAMSGRVTPDLVIRSRKVALPGGVAAASVFVRNGTIESIAEYGAPPGAAAEVDLGEVALLPGLVDSHVHLNEPGRTDWEGFASGTACRAGRRDHDDLRHAAELGAGDHDG